MIPADLQSKDPARRRIAIESLRGSPDPKAVEALATVAMNDTDPALRKLAVRTLLYNRPDLKGDDSVVRVAAQLMGAPPATAIQRLLAEAPVGPTPMPTPTPGPAPDGGADGTYEMLWDCAFCGTKKLLGLTHRHCGNCGAKQDPTLRYFPSDADKVAVKDHAYHGADKVCGFCQAATSAKAKNCSQCGASLDGTASAQARADQVQAAGVAFAGESIADARQAKKGPERSSDAGGVAKTPAPPPKKSPAGLYVVLGVVGLLVAVILVAVLWKRTAGVTVTAHSWEREVRIDSFGPKPASEWCDHVPLDAYRVTRSREVRSHEKVQDGEECSMRRVDKGNGTFSQKKECKPRYKDKPVYDEKCHFTVDRWGYSRSLTQKGASVAEAPAWPAVRMRMGAGNCIGCEREGGRNEAYKVHFVDKDKKTNDCKFSQEKWAGIAIGSKWTVPVAVMTGLPDCDEMKPAK